MKWWALLVVATLFLGFAATTGLATGTVTGLEVHDGRCGENHDRDCTRFDATVEYVVAGEVHRTVDHGWKGGHGVPPADAPLPLHDHPYVLYVRTDPSDGRALSAQALGYLAMGCGLPLHLGGLLLFGRRRTD
jgi:hypothetical protein